MHFQAGASYYEAGEYEDALREFQRAYDLSQRPELFYNFHLCYQGMGELEEAIDYLQRYLEGVEDIPNRSNLERRLENLRERIEEQRQGDATPEPQPDPPPVQPVDPGSTTPGPDPRPTPDDTGGGLPTSALVSFIVGGVGIAGMATFGILALGEQSSVEDGCGADRSCTEDDVVSMDTFALLSDLSLGVAVVGAALGVVFVVTADGGSGEHAGGVRVTPTASRDGAGVAVGGRF